MADLPVTAAHGAVLAQHLGPQPVDAIENDKTVLRLGQAEFAGPAPVVVEPHLEAEIAGDIAHAAQARTTLHAQTAGDPPVRFNIAGLGVTHTLVADLNMEMRREGTGVVRRGKSR